MKNVNSVVLVFCSAKNPGGGVTQGSIAQEESIVIHSSWFFQVKDVSGFYLKSKSNAINTDNLLYIDKGYLFTNEYGEDIEPIEISFIDSTAINLNGMKDQKHEIDNVFITKIMSQRIENILKLAQLYKKQELIL